MTCTYVDRHKYLIIKKNFLVLLLNKPVNRPHQQGIKKIKDPKKRAANMNRVLSKEKLKIANKYF